MKTASLALACAVVVGLSACVTSGNGKMKALTQQSVSGLLTPGKTTRAEVLEQLGQGNSFRFDSGYEVAVYEYASGIPRFVDYTPIVGHVSQYLRRRKKELRILFDPRGVVSKYLLLDTEPSLADEAGGDVDGKSKD